MDLIRTGNFFFHYSLILEVLGQGVVIIFRIYETLVSIDLGMKGKGTTEEKMT